MLRPVRYLVTAKRSMRLLFFGAIGRDQGVGTELQWAFAQSRREAEEFPLGVSILQSLVFSGQGSLGLS